MKLIRNIKQMSLFSRQARLQGKTIGFVPTMGALHEGHLSLIRCARKENDIVVLSIFVNPIQFGPKEDLRKYPRGLKRDTLLCKKEGVDIIFYPGTKEMYPDDYKTYVAVEGLSNKLCGKFRPGHFKGVATAVIKLFNIVSPNIAYFGQKDAQQSIIIQKMSRDLNLPVKIKVIPTMREIDGLAMSSRNAYLSPPERKEAAILYLALRLAKKLIKQGNKNSADIIRKMKQMIEKKKAVKVQYIALVDLSNLNPKNIIKGNILIALAVWVGKTRLIDNTIISVK